MSFRKILAQILVAGILQFGAFSGIKMDPEEIRKLMDLMHRTKVEYVVKKDDPPVPGL